VARATLSSNDGRPTWSHLDLDALDESELPAVSYPQGQGLSWSELVKLVVPLLAAPTLIGVSMADFDADHGRAKDYADRIVDALASAWP
jgi:arginase